MNIQLKEGDTFINPIPACRLKFQYVSANTEDGYTSIDSLTKEDVYSLYDGLVADFPHWVKRDDDIGVDADGNAIRSYTIGFLNPMYNHSESYTNVNDWDSTLDLASILITTGIHGDEKTASYGTALAIKEIVSSTETWAMYLKSNFLIRIIPIVNPWGFDNNTRENKEGVNINRDEGYWTTTEAQAVKAFIDNYSEKAGLILDMHGTSGKYPYYEIYQDDNFNEYLQCQARIAALVDSDWAELYGDDTTYPKMRGINSPFEGLLYLYGISLGMKGFIIETPRDIKDGSRVNYLKVCKIAKDLLINTLLILA